MPSWEDSSEVSESWKDGRELLAYTIGRGAFDLAPTYRYDIARWSGSHWSSRTGNIVTHLAPLDPPTEQTEAG